MSVEFIYYIIKQRVVFIDSFIYTGGIKRLNILIELVKVFFLNESIIKDDGLSVNAIGLYLDIVIDLVVLLI